MAEDTRTFVVAFPLHEIDRAPLRAMYGQPLPAIYPGSAHEPCDHCGLTLAVGPRTFAARQDDPTIGLLCPRCLVTATPLGVALTAINLGNPDSRDEDA